MRCNTLVGITGVKKSRLLVEQFECLSDNQLHNYFHCSNGFTGSCKLQQGLKTVTERNWLLGRLKL